ncbi:MAG: hypothetical protein AMXMBFR34_42740 [Myxococcaceae bacterium]
MKVLLLLAFTTTCLGCSSASSTDSGAGGGGGGGGGGAVDAGCTAREVLVLDTGAVTVEGDASTSPHQLTPSCGSAGRPNDVYRFTLAATEDVYVNISSPTWQPVVALYRGGACAAELSCSAANLQGTTSLTGTSLAAGDYTLVVDAVGTSAAGTYALYVQRPAVSPGVLSSGAPEVGLAGQRGGWRYFALSIAGAASLAVTASDGTGNADLYLARALPTTTVWLQASTGTTSSESLTVPNPADGTWYVGVFAKADYSALTLRATW